LLVARDLAGNGILDLIVANGISWEVIVLLGNGDGTFHGGVSYAIGASPNSMALGDVNGDGHLDLVVVAGGKVSILLGRGDGSFQSPVGFTDAGNPFAVAVADFTGGGLPDLAVTNRSKNGVDVFRNAADWGSIQPTLDPRSRGLAEASAPVASLAAPPAADRQAQPVQPPEQQDNRFLVAPGWTVTKPRRSTRPLLVPALQPLVDTAALSPDN
jgi:hypothetical protein